LEAPSWIMARLAMEGQQALECIIFR